MNLSMSTLELKKYIGKQLENIFPDKYYFEGKDVDIAIATALERTEFCFKYINMEKYNRNGQIWFDHLYSDQYATFLCYLGSSLWSESENYPLCAKIMNLNKVLNGLFCTYKTKLPNIFYLGHPIGTVMGNAIYSDFVAIMQNVTINSNNSGGKSPEIGKGVFLSAGVTIIGDGKIGDFCSIGANTLAYYLNVPDNSVVFTDSTGEINIKQQNKDGYSQRLFNVKIANNI